MMNRIRNLLSGLYVDFGQTSRLNPYLKKIEVLKRIKRAITSPTKVVLHGDQIFKDIWGLVGEEVKATSIVETGTFLGLSSEFFAKRFPNLKIYTCEIDKKNYLKAKKNLVKFTNIEIHNETSPKFLNYIINKGVLGERPIFFLDAHWKEEWPLKDELKIISTKLKSAVMVIDDFKVPNNKDFLFDQYDGVQCSLNLIIPNINKKNDYNLIFPNYGRKEAVKKDVLYEPLRGYVFIFQNMSLFFRGLKNKEFIKKHFLSQNLFR